MDDEEGGTCNVCGGPLRYGERHRKCGEAVMAAEAAERERCAELRRWKSTHAPRVEALEGLLRTAQLEAHAGREAIATLASERAANAILTEEVERLRAHAVTLAETAREVERERCIKACENEQLVDPTDAEGDVCYMRAVRDCIAAIRNSP